MFGYSNPINVLVGNLTIDFSFDQQKPVFQFCWNWNWTKKTIIFLFFNGISLIIGLEFLFSVFLFLTGIHWFRFFCFKKQKNLSEFFWKNSRIEWEMQNFCCFSRAISIQLVLKKNFKKKINFFSQKFHRVHYHHHMAFNLVVLTNECSECPRIFFWTTEQNRIENVYVFNFHKLFVHFKFIHCHCCCRCWLYRFGFVLKSWIEKKNWI